MMSTSRGVLIIGILGILTLLVWQNRLVVLPLVLLGTPTQALPLGIWVVGAIALGACVTLIFSSLIAWSTASTASRTSAYSPSGTSPRRPSGSGSGYRVHQEPVDQPRDSTPPSRSKVASPQGNRPSSVSEPHRASSGATSAPRQRNEWGRSVDWDSWSGWGQSTYDDMREFEELEHSFVDAEVLSSTPPPRYQPEPEYEAEALNPLEEEDGGWGSWSDRPSSQQPDREPETPPTWDVPQEEEDWDDWEAGETNQAFESSDFDGDRDSLNEETDFQDQEESDEEMAVWEDWDEEETPSRNFPRSEPPPPTTAVYEVRRDPVTRLQTGTIYSYSYRSPEESDVPQTPEDGDPSATPPDTDASIREEGRESYGETWQDDEDFEDDLGEEEYDRRNGDWEGDEIAALEDEDADSYDEGRLYEGDYDASDLDASYEDASYDDDEYRDEAYDGDYAEEGEERDDERWEDARLRESDDAEGDRPSRVIIPPPPREL